MNCTIRTAFVIASGLFFWSWVCAEAIQGTITSMDVSKNKLNVTRTDIVKSPQVVNVVVKDETQTKNVASLKELQVGQEVKIDAAEDKASGVWEARSIEVLSMRIDSRTTITPSAA